MQNILQGALKETKGALSNAVIKEVDCLASGFLQKTWRLQLNTGEQLFAKTAPAKDFPKLKCEANGLESLQKFNDPNLMEVPKPLGVIQIGINAILLLPWLDFGIGDQTLLGRGLAVLHRNSANQHPNKFGWDSDGFIGAGPQPGGWSKSWGQCFINLRLIPQLKIAEKWGINLSDWEELLSYLIIFLEKHEPNPSLVHGDLWSGNAAIQKDGKAVIFDPATWWADREVDLAMTRLFGGFSNEFYEGYANVWPLSRSANSRLEVYNLYHLLNHANIFGGSYKKQSISCLKSMKSFMVS